MAGSSNLFASSIDFHNHSENEKVIPSVALNSVSKCHNFHSNALPEHIDSKGEIQHCSSSTISCEDMCLLSGISCHSGFMAISFPQIFSVVSYSPYIGFYNVKTSSLYFDLLSPPPKI